MGFAKNTLFFILLFCCSVNGLAQYIQVNDTYTAQQLVENVLINSPCANVSNFTVNGDTFSPGEQSYGYFNSGGGSFPFANGVVLSTARAKRSEGPNDNLIDEGVTAWLGDSDLEHALNISNTFNATALEFDFTPLTSMVSFDYIFASEEYQGTAPCRYSDGFAFLLKEVGSPTPYQNLAIIPDTTTPVLVTSVHPDIAGSCAAANERYFGGYNGSISPINFNGQTVVMTAKASVTPGLTYHIKLVIADHENIRYDSAIFLGGGSFKVGTDLGEDHTIATGNPICQGTTYQLNAIEPGTNFYKWYRNNTIISGAVSPSYTVTTSGDYKVEISLGATACISTGEVKIDFAPLPVLANTTIVQCDEDHVGATLFNLTKADNIIKNGDSSLGTVTYYETLIAAQNQDAALAITNAANYSSIPKTVYASVGNAYGCTSIATVVLQISNNPVTRFRDFESCDLDGDIDGFYAFHLPDADSIILSGLPLGLVVEYYPTLDDALLQRNILPDIFTNTVQYQMYVYAKVLNGPDCYGIIPLHLYVNSNSPANFEDETVILCEGSSKTLEVATTFSTYLWSNGDTDHTTEVTAPGEYTITVSDSNTCLATKKFTVQLSQKPVITAVDTDNFDENGSNVLIQYSGNGNYEFSIDGNFYQDSPYFPNTAAGEYTVWARDKNGCGMDSKKIYVLNYPRYFTPNGDGYNDIWMIPNLSKLPNSRIDIFDRLGKLLYQFGPGQKGWNGKFNSRDLPSEDYWFIITMENSKTVKGHFALKR
jgi:gliding motility-associated-like protein